MNTENLNVKQLSNCESANINGGVGWGALGLLVAVHCLVQFAGNPRAHIEPFKEGMAMAQ
jgi:hypothetical protein